MRTIFAAMAAVLMLVVGFLFTRYARAQAQPQKGIFVELHTGALADKIHLQRVRDVELGVTCYIASSENPNAGNYGYSLSTVSMYCLEPRAK